MNCCKEPLVINRVQFNGLLSVQYRSPVLHLLFPFCQSFASLLFLSEGFQRLSAEIHIIDDFANLFASFGGAFTVAVLLTCILFITLKKNRSIEQKMWLLDTTLEFKNNKRSYRSTATFSLLESDNQMQGTACFSFLWLDPLEMEREEN